jgi:hypothetical protein
VNRALGDGASFEALDSTLSLLKKESDIDHRYLKVQIVERNDKWLSIVDCRDTGKWYMCSKCLHKTAY